MALKEHRPLHVVHVALKNAQAPSAIDATALNYLYALSGEVGAQMTVLTSEVAVTAMAEYAAQHEVCQILLGRGAQADGFALTLSQMLPGVEVLIVDEDTL